MKSRIPKKEVIACTALAGVLFFLGWFFVAGSRPSQLVDDAEPGALEISRPKERPSTGQAAEDPGKIRDAHRPGLDKGLQDASRKIGVPDIPANVIAKVRRSSLNRDGTISDALEELLSLSPEKVAFINEHIQNTAEVINEKELAALEVVRVTDLEVELRVPALSDSEELEAEFREAILAYLGDTDGQFFLDLIDSSHLGYLDGFGRFDRTMRFSVVPRDDGGFRVEFRQTSPPEQVERYYAERGMGISGEVEMGRGFGTLFPLRIELPNVPLLGRSIYMLDLLPEDMRNFFEAIERSGPD
jgi:hypothetical protein